MIPFWAGVKAGSHIACGGGGCLLFLSGNSWCHSCKVLTSDGTDIQCYWENVKRPSMDGICGWDRQALWFASYKGVGGAMLQKYFDSQFWTHSPKPRKLIKVSLTVVFPLWLYVNIARGIFKILHAQTVPQSNEIRVSGLGSRHW